MPFKVQDFSPEPQPDPLKSRDVRFGVNLVSGSVDTGRIGDIPKELQYNPARDLGEYAGSPDPISFAASLPFRGIGAIGSTVGQAMSGVSDMLNNFGPSKAYGESVGKPIGDVGKTLLDWLGGPGRFVQDIAARIRLGNPEGLPTDIRRMKESGMDEQAILDYMRETNRSFTDDALLNLGASIILDPLNLTPFVMGKVSMIPAISKVVGVGAGAAAGAAAGGIGTVGGAVAGFKAGAKIASKFPEAKVGFDLSRKLQAVQAAKLAPDMWKPWMSKYSVLADVHSGLFGKIKGVSDAVKGAFALKVVEVASKVYSSDAWNMIGKPIEDIFGKEQASVVARRAAVGFQQTALSAFRDTKTAGLIEAAGAQTDQFISDIREARRTIIEEEGGAGTAGEIAQRLATNTEQTGTFSRYGVDESLLEQEVSSYLDAAGAEYAGGVRYASPDRALSVWKAQRNITLSNAQIEGLATGVDWQRGTVEYAQRYGDQLAREMVSIHQGTVTRDAALVGAGSTSLVSDLVVQPLVNLASDIARSGSETLSNVRKMPGATAEQTAAFVEHWTQGGRIVMKGGRRMVVGGKYFDEYGKVVKNPILQRELATRIAWAQHIRFGYALNRVGNIRRVAVIASGFEAANEARQAAIRKEVSRLIGRDLSDEQLVTLGKMKDASVTRLTLLRNDSLVDVDVDRYLQAFELVKKADLKASELVAIGFPLDEATDLLNIRGANGNVVATIKQREQQLARWAERKFADVRNSSSLSKGSVDPEMVKALLSGVVRNDATFSAAKAGDIAGLKAFWTSIGGSADEIDNIIESAHASGYRVGIAPADNLMRVPTKVGVRNADGILVDEVISKYEPFVDLTSDFIDGLPIADGKYARGFFGNALRKLFSPTLQSEITSSARQRMLTSLGAYLTPDEIIAFDNAINEAAASQRVGVRGLVNPVGKSEIFKELDRVLTDRGVIGGLEGRLKEAVSAGLPRLDIDNAVLKAYAGEIGTSGVTQWLTGQIKANGIPGIGMNKTIAVMTERFYPTLKYAVNPFFWAQEIIESPFFAEMRGHRAKYVVDTLAKHGLKPQDVRALLGERGSNIAKNLHEASFATAVAARGGTPTTLASGIESQGILGTIKNIRNRIGGDSPVEMIGNWKEANRDIMAISEYSKRWAADMAKARPGEYLALVEEFGRDELDMLAGHLSRYQRNADLMYGDQVFNYIRPKGWGFAVRPSEQSLARTRKEAGTFIQYLADDDALSFMLQHKPSDLTRLLKLRVVDEARLGGYDVTRLNQIVGDIEVAARRVKGEAKNGLEYVKGSKAYSELKTAVDSLKTEVIDGLGGQIRNSSTNELILRRLFEKTRIRVDEKFEPVIQALASGRQYGAKFNSLGALIGEVFDRSAAGSGSFAQLSESAKIARIDSIINNIWGSSTLVEKQALRLTRTLHDSAIRLMNDHGAEEAFFQAAKFRYQETAREMDKINYFNPDRNLIERSLNHQFLALYPLSYMFGKVLPEAFRFLFWKPFGATAPGAGFQAYKKFVDYLAQNGFSADIEKNATQRPDYLFFLTQLIPGTPEDITVGVPGWLRRGISTISRQGYDQLTASGMAEELWKPFVTTGLPGAVTTGVKSMQELSSFLGGKITGSTTDSVQEDITTLR